MCPSVPHLDNPSRELGEVGVVGHHDDGKPCASVQVPQDLAYLHRPLRVEAPRRLVGKEDLRAVDERPGDARPLHLTP